MQLLQPWRTQIAKINITEQVDLDALVQEMLTLPPDVNGDLTLTQDLNLEEYPHLAALQSQIIVPKALWYMAEVFDHPVETLRTKTWAVVLSDGVELVPHYHASSLLTSVFYPIDSDAHLTLFDPRGNACRGYPVDLRDKHFSNQNITPKAGDLYLFPSYIHHYVAPTHQGLRMSLASDFFIN